MKSTKRIWFFILAGIVVAGFAAVMFSKRTDIDACPYTSKIRTREYFLGYVQSERIEDTEVTRWLRDEFDISGPIRFEDHGNAEAVAMTLPGNWVFLDYLKHIYEINPETRPYIQNFIRELYATDDPRITAADLDRLEARFEKP